MIHKIVNIHFLTFITRYTTLPEVTPPRPVVTSQVPPSEPAPPPPTRPGPAGRVTGCVLSERRWRLTD